MSTNPQRPSPPADGPRTRRVRAWRLPALLLVVHLALVAWLGTDALSLATSGIAWGGHSGMNPLALVEVLPILALLGALFAGPFLMLLPERTPARLGRVALALSLAGLAVVAWQARIEPGWRTHRFEQVMQAVHVVRVTETPQRIDGQVAGVRIEMEVSVDRPIVPPHARPFMELLRTEGPTAQGGRPGEAPYLARGPLRVVGPDGRAFDGDVLLATDRPVPAGTYRSEQTFWWPGLRQEGTHATPCSDAADPIAAATAQVSPAALRWALRPIAGIRPYQGPVRGWTSRVAVVQWPLQPLQMRIDPAWPSLRPGLSLERCDARQVRERAQAEQARLARNEEAFRRGDSLAPEDDPLRREACAGNLDGVRRLLAFGTPRRPVSGVILECTERVRRDDVFELLLPAAHARDPDGEDYCNVLQAALRQRDIGRLERVHRLGLPLLCPQRAHWRAVMTQITPDGSPPSNPEPLLPWLRWLKSMQAPLCRNAPDRSNLLQYAAAEADRASIEFLLAEGCDPQVFPDPKAPSGSTERVGSFSAALLWRLRLAPRTPEQASFDPDPAARAAITARLGDVAAAELNEARSGAAFEDGATAMTQIGFDALLQPTLLRYLIGRGVRLDAAGANGYSWFLAGYATTADRHPMAFVRTGLDSLTADELRAILRPVIVSTGQPGRAMDQASNMAPGAFGHYLCGRGVVPCAAGSASRPGT